MSAHRTYPIMRSFLGLLALAALLVPVGLTTAGPAAAAGETPAPAASATVDLRIRDTVVKAGEDVTIAAGESVATVVVLGGDVIVHGTVRDTVVAFGGDVKLGPTARVGTDMSAEDAAIVVIGGTITRALGAEVSGQTQTFDSAGWGDTLGWAAQRVVVTPWWGLSLAGWLVQTAFFLVLALVAAALMPNQMRGVERHLGRRPWVSLGWGALSFFLVVPVVLVVLVISVVGLLLVIPYALFVSLVCFFATTAVGAFIAQRVLSGAGRKENLMLAVTLGVVGTTIVSRIPVAGPLLIGAMMIFGSGAAVLAVADWRRERARVAAVQAVAASPAAYPATALAAPMDAGGTAAVTGVGQAPSGPQASEETHAPEMGDTPEESDVPERLEAREEPEAPEDPGPPAQTEV